MGNQLLKLVHHVVIDLLSFVFSQLFWLAVINTEQVVAECRHHKELLHHTVHVADAAKVDETTVLLVSL